MSTKPRTKGHLRPKPHSSPHTPPLTPLPAVAGRVARAPTASGPEIRTRYTPAGRETLAAIAEELAGPGGASLPDIEIGEGLAGRDTLVALADELLEPPPRERRQTLGFEEEAASRITDAGGSGRGARGQRPPATPRNEPRSAPATPPERGAAAPKYRARGQASLDAIEQHLEHWARTGEPGRPSGRAPDPVEIFEMVTFVVRGELTRLASMAARREFVAERLMRRLPVDSIEDVDRIDVTPWTVKGTVIVRVWCRI